MRYMKRPVTIEAMEFMGSNATDIIRWIIDSGHKATHIKGDILIDTMEGTMRAVVGDFIIQGVEGEFYPCSPSVFTKTYVAVV